MLFPRLFRQNAVDNECCAAVNLVTVTRIENGHHPKREDPAPFRPLHFVLPTAHFRLLAGNIFDGLRAAAGGHRGTPVPSASQNLALGC